MQTQTHQMQEERKSRTRLLHILVMAGVPIIVSGMITLFLWLYWNKLLVIWNDQLWLHWFVPVSFVLIMIAGGAYWILRAQGSVRRSRIRIAIFLSFVVVPLICPRDTQ